MSRRDWWFAGQGVDWRALLPALILVALAYFWRFGYSFGAGDHDELLPPVLALLDPTLFLDDWYVQLQTSGFNTRSPFTAVLAVLAALLSLEGATVVLYAGSLLAVLGGLYWLGRELGGSPLAAAGGAFAAAVLTSTWTLGGNAILYPVLVPELLAWALIVPAMVLVLRRRLIGAAVLIGVAAWFQVLAAALAAASFGLALLALSARHGDRALAYRTVVHFGGVCLTIAAPFVALVGLAPLETATPPDRTLSSFYVIAELRLPHHYLPLSFGLDRYVKFFAVAVPGVAALWWLHRHAKVAHGRFLLIWLGIVALFCSIAFAFIEGFGSLFAAKLQVFKLTAVVQAVLAIVLVIAATRLAPGPIIQRCNAAMERPGLLWPVAVAGLLFTIALAVAGIGRPGALYEPLQHARSDLHEVEQWSRQHTHADALFVVPPSNTTFRTHARRSVVVTFKPTPFQDELMHTWLDRLLAIAPAELPEQGDHFLEELDEAYYGAGWEHWQDLRQRFGADYVLLDVERAAEAFAAAPAHRAGRWAVFELTDRPVDS